jgi:chorismate mutase
MTIPKENLHLQGLRGAITTKNNTAEAIEASVSELVKELIKRNQLTPEQIVSITFSVTADLNACFPAAIARKQTGWENVALLDCQQMYVEGDLKYCIRIMAHVWLPIQQNPQHTYLGEASLLRPDRSQKN